VRRTFKKKYPVMQVTVTCVITIIQKALVLMIRSVFGS
jgi:hypothetical protein